MAKYYKMPVVIATNLVESLYTDDYTADRNIVDIIVKKSQFNNKYSEIVTDMEMEYADILNQWKYKIKDIKVILSLKYHGVWIGCNSHSYNTIKEATTADIEEYLENFENSEFKEAYDKLQNAYYGKSEKAIRKIIKNYKKRNISK